LRAGLDSAYPPTPAQIAQAKAAGYSAWLGYFAGPNILNGWADSDFQNVRAGGMETGAYCSGWADPVAMKARATALGITGILDDESGIRSLSEHAVAHGGYALPISQNRLEARYMMHGGYARPVLEIKPGSTIWTVSAWVQPWLDASGFGQYGNMPVFAGVHASRYVFAAYPGVDPGATWPSYYPRPTSGSCGWQFQGTTQLFGKSVDLSHFDDNFFGQIGADMAFIEPPFKIRTHAGAHWYGSAGGQDMGLATQGDYNIVTVSPDNAYYLDPGSSWWFAASQCGILLGAAGEKGPTGDKGATGDKGPIGDKGPTGDSGVGSHHKHSVLGIVDTSTEEKA